MGIINVNLPTDGSTADVSDVNNPINTIVTAINGGLDNDNIKPNAGIDGSKLAAGSTAGLLAYQNTPTTDQNMTTAAALVNFASGTSLAVNVPATSRKLRIRFELQLSNTDTVAAGFLFNLVSDGSTTPTTSSAVLAKSFMSLTNGFQGRVSLTYIMDSPSAGNHLFAVVKPSSSSPVTVKNTNGVGLITAELI